MSANLDPPVQHGYDLNAIDAVLSRVCVEDAEIAAFKRVLGVDKQEVAASEAYAPDRPPATASGPQFDHVQRTRDAIAKYSAWVDSFPDNDSTPFAERERILNLSRLDLKRLTGE